MNLDELKKTWQAYDQKLAATNLINEKLIKNMITERSSSTLSKIRRDSMLTMVLVAGFCVLSIIYNAFDYQYTLQYLPLALTATAMSLFSILLIKEYTVAKADLHKDNLAKALKKALLLHKKFMSSNRKLGLIIVLGGMPWPISNLPQIIERKGLLPALGLIFLTLAVQAIFLFLAQKAGAFKDRRGNQSRAHLRELEEFGV